jgi:hypothetical protein
MPPKNKTRPIFLLDKQEDQIVKSGGIIFYRFSKGIMELLINENRGMIEDLGGCTDIQDKDIFSTVAREVEEESNNKFIKKDIKKRIKKTKHYVYMKKSKYVVYFLECTNEESKFKTIDFGNKEIHDDVFRTIKWIPLDIFLLKEVIQFKLNFRLKNKKIFDMLKYIKSNHIFTKNLFIDSNSSKDI